MLIGPVCGIARVRARASTPRRPRCTGTPSRRSPSTAAPRSRRPSGRPSAASGRRGRGSRTCTACPRPTPGTKISQTPELPRLRMACPRPTQWLKSPTTRTRPGVGRPDREARAGDLAERVERGRRRVVAHVGAEDVPQLLVPALADQVEVDLAEGRQVPVRVVDDRLADALVASRRAGSRAPAASAARPTQTPSHSCSSGTREPSPSSTSTDAANGRSVAHRDRAVVDVGAEHLVRGVVRPGPDLFQHVPVDRARAGARRGLGCGAARRSRLRGRSRAATGRR